MRLRGKVWKEGTAWLIQCPELGAYTEGRRSKKDAFRMMVDWVQTMLDRPDFTVDIREDGDDEFVMAFDDPAPILGLMLQRARTGRGMSLQDVAAKAGIKHRTAVGQAEAGTSEVSISRLSKLLEAMGLHVEIRVVEDPKAPRVAKTRAG